MDEDKDEVDMVKLYNNEAEINYRDECGFHIYKISYKGMNGFVQ